MSLALLILCLVIVIQILKIIIKTNIIDKKLVDYNCEYIVLTIAFFATFFRKEIDEHLLMTISIICVIYEIFSVIYAYYNYIKKEKLNNLSIKNIVDSSNIGILVLRNNKKVLTNSAMNKILERINIKDNYIKNINKKNIEKTGEDYILKVDENFYLFNINQNEIIAFDVTEEYELQCKLNKQNEKIMQNNKELIDSIENIEKYEKEKNLLELKNKYHDLLGQNLSILQQYLNRPNIAKDNLEEIKYLIKEMFIDIKEIKSSKDKLNELIEIHNKSGTKILLEGKLPQNEEKAIAFFEIIREAVTNAIRHANSTEVYIKIKDDTEHTKMTIRNNGKKPKAEIIENEGIKGMRRKIAQIGGKIEIITKPEFLINIEI